MKKLDAVFFVVVMSIAFLLMIAAFNFGQSKTAPYRNHPTTSIHSK